MSFREIIFKIFNNFFRNTKFFPQPTIDYYAKKVESIDDLGLAKMFKESITPEIEQTIQSYDKNCDIYDYPLQTSISEQHTKEIARKFFSSIDSEISAKIIDIIDGKNPDIQLEMKPFDGKHGASVSSPDPSNKPLKVFVPMRGDLRQLYEFVHELTHTLDIANGDTITRRILGEVAPQCMERMLDTFLLEMTDEEMRKYGFDKSTLEKDIKDRRITTFITRYHNVQALNNGSGNRELDSRYMLAQIYSAQFSKFDKKEQKSRIKSFIGCVGDDDFEGANDILRLQIDRNNKLQRGFYIGYTIEEIKTLVLPKATPSSTSLKKSKEEINEPLINN